MSEACACGCPDGEVCLALKMHLGGGRLWEVWQGKALTPEKCEAHRRLWKEQAGVGVQVGVVRQAATAAVAAAKHVAAGRPKADEATVKTRQALCLVCPHRTPDERCARCGCGLKTKTAWALEKCPIGKW